MIVLKFVVAPDSFKESLSASEVAATIAQAILGVKPDANIELVPMADGGEGTVEALVAAAGGQLLHADVTGPRGSIVKAGYGIIGSDAGEGGSAGEIAVLEAASVFGLSMVAPEERNPYRTTTRGMGELLLQLMDRGIRRFIVGIGGSGTNDGGMGLLSALGMRFTDSQGNELAGYGEDLLQLADASVEGLDSRLAECEIVIASDVQNPLCGDNGASAIYGPQKGATPEQVAALDKAMARFAAKIESLTGRNYAEHPGAGAAGGAGYALLSLGGRITPGAEVIGSAAQLRGRMAGADWVITGEGKSDNQTLNGKLPLYVSRLAGELGIRTILISGSLGERSDELEREFAACFPCVPRPMALSACLEHAERHLLQTTRNVVRLL